MTDDHSYFAFYFQLEGGYLKHIIVVFERLGFVVTNGDLDWDVMWTHEYPFTTMAKVITALKPHQRVNSL